MKISTYITERQIHIGIKHKRKRDIFKELLALLISAGKLPSEDQKNILNSLVEREKLGSTAIGQGIAIPHARITGIKKPLLVIGTSEQGVEFDSLDGEPVHVIFLILSPKDEAGLHLKMLATISKLLRDTFLITKLKKVDTAKKLRILLREQEDKL